MSENAQVMNKACLLKAKSSAQVTRLIYVVDTIATAMSNPESDRSNSSVEMVAEHFILRTYYIQTPSTGDIVGA